MLYIARRPPSAAPHNCRAACPFAVKPSPSVRRCAAVGLTARASLATGLFELRMPTDAFDASEIYQAFSQGPQGRDADLVVDYARKMPHLPRRVLAHLLCAMT
jgi:hypothetical protein